MKKKTKRKLPKIKVGLENYTDNFEVTNELDIISYKRIDDKELVNKDNYRIIFDTCIFKNTKINHNKFDRSEFIDVVFKNCDLSNNDFDNSLFIRCEFIECKLVGSNFSDCTFTDVLIKDSICDYAVIFESKLKSLEIISTSFKESNLIDTELKNVTFNSVNFKKAIISNTKLKDIDLSSCMIEDIKIDHRSIEGSTIASWQAESVCYLLGVKIK